MKPKPEVGIVAATGRRAKLIDSATEKNPVFFVAFYPERPGVAAQLKRHPVIEVPASRVCPDADQVRGTTPVCDYPGWSFEDADAGPPPKKCPGTRWNGQPCGKRMLLKNAAVRKHTAHDYRFKATSKQDARFFATKFPLETDRADAYTEIVDGRITHPGAGRSWSQLLEFVVAPEDKRWKRPDSPDWETKDEVSRYPPTA